MSQAGPTPARPVVLVVDDEDEIRTALLLTLQSAFEVVGVASAEAAEDMLRQRKFELILCDHLMSGEDGLPFLIRMREKYPLMKRVLLTSYINPEMLSRSTSLAGLSACLTKPMPGADLIAALWQALAQPQG